MCRAARAEISVSSNVYWSDKGRLLHLDDVKKSGAQSVEVELGGRLIRACKGRLHSEHVRRAQGERDILCVGVRRLHFFAQLLFVISKIDTERAH